MGTGTIEKGTTVNDARAGKNREYVLQKVRDENIKFIRIWFCDILGTLKSFAITAAELEGALDEGMGFDGSSIQGFTRIDESDMVAKPDPATFVVMPWRASDGSGMARMFADVLKPGGEPYKGDPRYVLKRNIERAAKLGYTYYIGPELEFFYFKSADAPEPLDRAGYFDMSTDFGIDVRKETVLTLERLGIEVEYSHHEVAPSQHEIDLRYTDGLTMADSAMTYRYVVKEVARKHGVYATFMPKPLEGENGSGMHVHQSLFKGDRNAFFDKDGKWGGLSATAEHYIAGLMSHAAEFTLVTNQWYNSYKRLTPGFEAPCYISWARRNRSDMIRVPMYKPGKEQATRIELRSADPACNPYLAFAVMLAAGLDGIEKEMKLAEPIEENLFEMSAEQRHERGIENLPGSLAEAIAEAERSEWLRETLGDHVFTHLIRNKKLERDRYRMNVTPMELTSNMPVL